MIMAREYIALRKLYGVKQAGISTEETAETKEARRIGAPFEKADENSSIQQTIPSAEKAAAPKEVQPAEQAETVTHPGLASVQMLCCTERMEPPPP